MAITVTQAFKDAQKGAVDRTQTKVEVYLSGALGWVDITGYVEEWSTVLEESPPGGRASANTLNLTLINDDGRFSPDNSASPYSDNLLPNKPIRVSTLYGSESVREFTGYVSNWIPSALARSCQVTAEDTARILARKDIVEETVFDPVTPTTGYYLTRVLERAAYLSGLRWDAVTTRAAAWTNLDQDGNSVNEITATYDGTATRAVYTLAGALVMTLDLVDLYLLCSPLKGKCLAVLQQIADVVGGVVTFDQQGQLIFRCRMYRNDSTLSSVETFTVANLEDLTVQTNFEDSKFSQLVNRAVVRSTPYTFKVDSSGAVIEEDVDFKGDLFAKYHFNAGESYPGASDADLYCEMPNGIKLFKTSSYPSSSNLILRSVDNADTTKETKGIVFQAGYPVFEQNRIKLAFTNNGSGAERISSLKFKGKLMRPVQRCQSIQKNQDSIDLYDQRDKEVTNDLIPSAGACKNLAGWMVEDGRTPKKVYTIRLMHGCSWLELGDKITVSETITNTIPTTTEAIVRRITKRWTLAAVMVTIEACSPSPNFTAGSFPATVTNVETLNQNHLGNKAGDAPFTLIDKSTKNVGLNNIPAFRGLIEQTLNLTFASMNSEDIAIGGGYLWTVGTAGKLNQITPYNGTQVGTATLTASNLLACDHINGLLWVLDDGMNLRYVNSTLGTGVKHTFSGFTMDTSPDHSAVMGTTINGTKYLWVLVGVGAGGSCKLYRFSDLTTTAAAPDLSLTIDTSYSGIDLVADANRVYVLTDGFIWSVTPSGTVNQATSGNTPGQGFGATCDGQNLYACFGASPAKLVRYALRTSAFSGQTTVIEQESLNLSNISRLFYDGEHLWAVSRSTIYQIDTATLAILATFKTGLTDTGIGQQMAFDGQAIWVTTETDKLIRIPKISASR